MVLQGGLHLVCEVLESLHKVLLALVKVACQPLGLLFQFVRYGLMHSVYLGLDFAELRLDGILKVDINAINLYFCLLD